MEFLLIPAIVAFGLASKHDLRSIICLAIGDLLVVAYLFLAYYLK